MRTVKNTSFKSYLEKELNFFRVHLLAFVFIPLICSGIFYGCNGRFPVSYVDALFLCYSAMTVTGLSTVNLSTLTAWQQVILYLLMLIGDITFVSWIMVLVRKEYFKRKCEYVVSTRRFKRGLPFRSRTTLMRAGISEPRSPRLQRVPRDDADATLRAPDVEITSPTPSATLQLGKKSPAFHPTAQDAFQLMPMPEKQPEPILEELHGFSSSPRESLESRSIDGERPGGVLDDVRTFSSSPQAQMDDLPPMSPTAIDFAQSTAFSPSSQRQAFRRNTHIPTPHRKATRLTTPKRRNALVPGEEPQRRYQDLGGFPGPLELAKRVYHFAAPKKLQVKLERTMTTVPMYRTLEQDSTPWLTFRNLIVGRNSNFLTETLDDDQLAEIGGTEYRALRLLSYLVPLYFVGTQLISYILFVPWLVSTTKYDEIFAAQPREVKKPWFGLFQVMGAYTGGGLSLVDMGMVPFGDAYLMIFALAFTILAGNHALPVFLRFSIWVLSKIVNLMPERKNTWGATLSFLLNHPRRCFIYLFPAHQTWFLLIALIVFSALEWVAFPILNIGLPVYEAMKPGPKVVDGFFQGLAVRASGFSIVPIASLSPALQFLYVVFMYIAIYPIALSIRSTNVYEERSLGVFEDDDEDDEEPEEELKGLSNRERVNRYLGWHLRRQTSVDLWWLVWGVFLVAIIERHNIMDQDKKWFDLFRVLFELVSAFGGIGLTLGLPDNNFSFVGEMRTLSKLVVIVIMVRGRHRGLPVAVDRAVLLPSELVTSRDKAPEAQDETENRQEEKV